NIYQTIRTLYTVGGPINATIANVTTGASDSNGSIYRMFTNLNPNVIPLLLYLGNEANSGCTGYDVGLYVSGVGEGAAFVDNIFATGLDLSSAHASLNPKTALDAMSNLAIDAVGKRLYEHAGHTTANMLQQYDIAITADTAGSQAKKISLLMIWAQG